MSDERRKDIRARLIDSGLDVDLADQYATKIAAEMVRDSQKDEPVTKPKLSRRDHPITEALRAAAHGHRPDADDLDAVERLVEGTDGRSLRGKVKSAADALLERGEAGERAGALWPAALEQSRDLIDASGTADWRPADPLANETDPRKLADRVLGRDTPAYENPDTDDPRALADSVRRY